MGSTQDLAETGRDSRIAGVSREEVRKWYALMHLSRVLDDKAPNYLKQGLGWSYHAPCAGHDAILVKAWVGSATERSEVSWGWGANLKRSVAQ